ncbi:MAG TPA: Gfo/Idh/MocA family oxidoreductase, partial [Propionibacteriaceae bacterium]|nr:Gfo/Idh/MocA family oxidoreductase [Propionibacteriaceae bacterium]
GIIGVGDVTEVKSAPEVFRASDSDVVHVMRRDRDRARDFAERHHVARWSTDAQAVIDDPDVTAVYVATPTATHATYAIAAARAGKDVLVEKPLAMSATEGRTIVDAAREAGVRLWVAYYRRALPRFLKLRELIASGQTGRLLSVHTVWRKPTGFSGWRWDPAVNRGGEFYETACHTLDALDMLLGPASETAGVVSPDLHAVAASYRFSDVVGSGSWTFGTPDAVEETVLTGTEGTLSFATFSPTPIRLVTERGTTLYEIDDPRHVHGPLVATILDELRGVGTCPSTGESALRTAVLMDAILGL